MGKPKMEVENKEYYKDIYFLYEILNSLENVEEVKRFIKDILTRSELRMIKRRWHIALLLDEKLDIRTIAQRSKTSTQTVSKIKKILDEGNGGLKDAIEKVKRNTKREQDQLVARVKRGGSKFVKGW